MEYGSNSYLSATEIERSINTKKDLAILIIGHH